MAAKPSASTIPFRTRSPTRSTSRTAVRTFYVLLALLLLWQFRSLSSRSSPADSTSSSSLPPPPPSQTPANGTCPEIPGIADVFVVVKAGVVEHRTKLPVHFSTTLRCVPRYAVYSDYAETIGGGHAVADALEGVDLKAAARADAEFYDRLRRDGGQAALSKVELEAWGGAVAPVQGNNGGGGGAGTGDKGGKKAQNAQKLLAKLKEDNPGRRLDKWKMVPAVDKALRAAPDAKWFVFVEPDTYVLWANLVEWLQMFDADAPWYLGEPEQVGADVFANGGAGVVLSVEAARKVSTLYKENAERVERITASRPNGPAALGRVLKEVGVPLTWSWPNLQSGSPSRMDWGEARHEFGRLWCHRAVSYHGISTDEIDYLYTAEQAARAAGTPLTHHSHVFQDFVMSQLSSLKPNWDNFADRKTFRKLTKKGLKSGRRIKNWGDCRLECDQYGNCIGFSWIGKECRFNTKFQLGQKNTTSSGDGKILTSGFMTDRVDWMIRWLEDESCRKWEEWVLPVPFDSTVDEEDD
ncbi:putative fringe-like protein [Lasiodiplodia theobromae]|nr:putative fringe-like protein [Lasiodiplodia theobromae]